MKKKKKKKKKKLNYTKSKYESTMNGILYPVGIK